VWPVIAQQIERNSLRVGIGAQRKHRIAGDGQHPGSQSQEPFMIISNGGELVTADAGKGKGIEDDHRRCTT